MGSDNCYDGVVDPYSARLIKCKARQLVGRVGFTESDRKDIEQDLILDLLRRLSKYNPKRARRNTFIRLVVEHKVASIVEAKKAGVRDYRLCSCSLNERLESEEGGFIERGQIVDEEEYLRRTGRLSRPAAEVRDLRLDVREVVEHLPTRLRELCHLLETDSISEVSRDTGVPRSTLYDSIKRLRGIFTDAGLRECL